MARATVAEIDKRLSSHEAAANSVEKKIIDVWMPLKML